jgi:hypothetical protein
LNLDPGGEEEAQMGQVFDEVLAGRDKKEQEELDRISSGVDDSTDI